MKKNEFPSIWEKARVKLSASSVCLEALPRGKAELFRTEKPKEELTEEELATLCEKILKGIDRADFEAFRDKAKPGAVNLGQDPAVVDEYYPLTADGYAGYLYLLLVDSGLYFIGVNLFNEATKEKDIRRSEAAYASTIWEVCLRYAKQEFPPEPLPKMPQRPKKHISPNDKLMHALTTHSIINGGEVNLSVLPNDGITTYVMAIYEPDKEMEPFNLSPFERTVMDAVCSIYRQAKLDGDDFPVMTPASIYKAMPGGGSYPTAAMQEKIAEVYTKMRHIFVKLDGTEHLMKLKKIKPGEKYTKETNMLLAEEHTYRRQNGTTSIGWQLFQKPVILDYAEMTGQLVNVPAKVMQIEGLKTTGEPDGLALNMNETRRELLAYLVRRVAVIKHAQESALREANYKRNRAAGKSWREFMKKSPVILFESAFEATKITATNRKTLKDCKDFCRAVLKYWKGINYIFGYQEVKQGRADRGLEILFREV